MELDRSLFRGNPVARMLVSVDALENGEPQGEFLSIYMSEPEPFSGIIQMVNGMDSYFDRVDYPQAYNAYRTFDGTRQPGSSDKDGLRPVSEDLFDVKRGTLCTFLIQVLFRQNTDWQGVVTWMEDKKTQRFRSTLEMMKLMQHALDSVGGGDFGEW